MGYDGSASSPTGTEMQRALRRLFSHIAVHVQGGLISFQSSSLVRLVPSQPLCFRFDSACVLPDEAANRRCKSGSWVSVCGWSSQWSHFCLTASFWPVTNGICYDVFRLILKSWLSLCDELLITSSLRNRGLSVLILLHNHYFIKAAKTPHVTHNAIDSHWSKLLLSGEFVFPERLISNEVIVTVTTLPQ